MIQTNQDPFHAIADWNRREILNLLSKSSKSVNSLADNFSISRPAVSKHIKILCTAGFITIEEKGRERLCSLKQEGFEELQKWIRYYESFWNKKLDNLENYLTQIQNKKHGKKI